MIHPERGRGWTELPYIPKLRQLAHGAPIGFTESMYYVDKRDRARATEWSRGPDGWTWKLSEYQDFISKWQSGIDYGIIHDEKGVQCDPSWPRGETDLEGALAEVFGGRVDPPKGKVSVLAREKRIRLQK